MDFAALKLEFAARGFDYFDDTRRGLFINQARAELDDVEMWPYREASATGLAPLAVSDLGTIERVVNITNPGALISPAEYGELAQWFSDLSTDGTPEFFYTAWPAGAPTVATYPESTDTIGVQYWRVTDDLDVDSDEPAAPSRFHRLILDIAVRDAYRDADNHQAAEAMQAQIDRDLARMRQALFSDQLQGPRFIRIVAGSDDS